MKRNKFALSTVYASIGAIINIVVSYLIAYFATGGSFFNGTLKFNYGDMWLLVTIMAMVSPILSLLGSLILPSAPKVAGVLLIISALEYVVVALMSEMEVIPYLLLFSVGAVILLVTGIYCISTNNIHEQISVDYVRTKDPHLKEEKSIRLEENKK